MTAYGLQPVLVTTKAVITLIVASVTLRLTKKFANHAPAAVLFILRIRLKGIQGSQSFLALLAGQLKSYGCHSSTAFACLPSRPARPASCMYSSNPIDGE